MRRSQFGLVVLVSASSLGVCAVGSAKTVDCLHVAVVSQSADLKFALNPVQTRPGIRPLHMILTNVCSVDITAFTLELNVTSPIPQTRQFGADMLGGLAAFNTWKIPRAGTEFPYDGVIGGEPEDDPRPLEFTVKARGLIFRDGTAAGDAAWVAHVQERRKSDVQDFAAELKLLAQIARLEDARAILNGDPDSSLSGPVRTFWLECKRSLSKDPASWAASINDRASWVRSLNEAFTKHPDLTIDDK